MIAASFVAAILALAPAVSAHGQMRYFTSSSGTYSQADAYAAADPASPIRKVSEYGPAAPFNGANITCGPGGNIPTANLAEVKAGEEVQFDWQNWSSAHSGPLMTYLAKCEGGCATFKGDTGDIWVKIDQDQYNPDRTEAPWGENILHNGGKYNVTIPAGLADGEYLLRHEILALHTAGQLNGAQFYPTCIQIKVTGGGSVELPTGVAFPGEYKAEDEGILVELWRVQQSPSPGYRAPGGAVLLAGGSGDWGVEHYGGTPALPTGSGSSSSAAAPASTTTAAVTSSAAPVVTSSATPVTTAAPAPVSSSAVPAPEPVSSSAAEPIPEPVTSSAAAPVSSSAAAPATSSAAAPVSSSAAPAPVPVSSSVAPAPPATTAQATSALPASSSAAAPAPTGSASGSVQKWGQCGGAAFTGATACAAGLTCKEWNPYYSQCL